MTKHPSSRRGVGDLKDTPLGLAEIKAGIDAIQDIPRVIESMGLVSPLRVDKELLRSIENIMPGHTEFENLTPPQLAVLLNDLTNAIGEVSRLIAASEGNTEIYKTTVKHLRAALRVAHQDLPVAIRDNKVDCDSKVIELERLLDREKYIAGYLTAIKKKLDTQFKTASRGITALQSEEDMSGRVGSVDRMRQHLVPGRRMK